MGQDIQDALERLACSADTPGKVHDQLAVSHTGQTPRKTCQVRLLQTLHTHELRNTGHFHFEDGARRLGSHVTRRESGTARGEDRVAFVTVSPAFETPSDLLLVIRQN